MVQGVQESIHPFLKPHISTYLSRNVKLTLYLETGDLEIMLISKFIPFAIITQAKKNNTIHLQFWTKGVLLYNCSELPLCLTFFH